MPKLADIIDILNSFSIIKLIEIIKIQQGGNDMSVFVVTAIA